MTSPRRHVRFLASVTSESEAIIAALGGADIIDCKNPASGALGALPVVAVRAIRAAVPPAIPVSATIGDLPCEAGPVTAAATAMGAARIEYVKVGLFPGSGTRDTIAALGEIDLGDTPLVGVILADLEPDFSLVEAMGEAGFAGAMLDTAGKQAGSLTDHLSMGELSDFLRRARDSGLFAGLAGALRFRHIPALMALEPDVLGFRGALCEGGRREGGIEEAAIRAIRQAISRESAGRERDRAFAGELT